MYLFAIIGLLASVISAFYYLRVIKIMYFDKEEEKFDEISGFGMKLSLSLSSILILLYFINPSILLEFTNLAAVLFS